MYQYCTVDNNNNENTQRPLSPEYSSQSYHDMQPASYTQLPIVHETNHPPAFPARDPRFNDLRSATQLSPSTSTSIIRSNNNHVTSTVLGQSPNKRRRATTGGVTASSTRKRFDPIQQNTAATLMNNLTSNIASTSARTVTTGSTLDTAQHINEMMKPIVKCCEETNKLIKDLIQQNSEQILMLKELVNYPREIQKVSHQISHVLHMQAKVLQTRSDNDDDDIIMDLNGVNLHHVSRGASINATARALVRAAYGDDASYNSLGVGEFDILLNILARKHGQQVAYVLANSYSIKNSLQQMKHDGNKKYSSNRLSNAPNQHQTTTIDEPSPMPNNGYDRFTQ